MTVDCYAAQHPTQQSNQKSAQSIAIHLISINLSLEHNYTAAQATKAMQRLVPRYKGQFKWIKPPEQLGDVTIADVVNAKNFEEHEIIVKKWARSVWNVWSDHHPMIRELIDKEF